jgi:hypothetical protein
VADTPVHPADGFHSIAHVMFPNVISLSRTTAWETGL